MGLSCQVRCSSEINSICTTLLRHLRLYHASSSGACNAIAAVSHTAGPKICHIT
jgi:hypothetical protein